MIELIRRSEYAAPCLPDGRASGAVRWAAAVEEKQPAHTLKKRCARCRHVLAPILPSTRGAAPSTFHGGALLGTMPLEYTSREARRGREPVAPFARARTAHHCMLRRLIYV